MRSLFMGTATAVLLLTSVAAHAELAVSANDGKQIRKGDTINHVVPDSVTVFDITPSGVKRLGSVAAPACMIGSPTSVAVSKNSQFAIVTACQKMEGDKLVPNDTASVIDLSVPSKPRVIQTITTGMQPGGVSISPNGRLVLIANSVGNSISIFTISGEKLTAAGTLQLPAKSEPADVVFTPDGKTAIALGRASSELMILSVDGSKVSYTGRSFSTGRNPYGAVVTHDGKYIINTNLGGANPPPGSPPPAPHRRRTSTVSISDIATGKLMQSVDVGPVSEDVSMSADGRYIAVVVANGTASVRSDPRWNKVWGLLEIYKVGNGTLTPAGRSDTGHWCQGSTFSKDNKTILLQCAAEREIEVFHYDGHTLTWDKSASIPMEARPGAIATALSR